MKNIINGEFVEVEPIEVVAADALTAINRSEIDSQITTARAYPRSIKESRRQLEEIACLNEETAAGMTYNPAPRRQKKS